VRQPSAEAGTTTGRSAYTSATGAVGRSQAAAQSATSAI
jgi:hypothetical protein